MIWRHAYAALELANREIEAHAPGETASHVVLGRIVGIHLRDSLVDAKGRFDTVGAGLMARMGGLQYASIGEVIELPAAHRRIGDSHER